MKTSGIVKGMEEFGRAAREAFESFSLTENCIKKINILGTDYTIKRQTKEDNSKLENAFGFCEQYSKEIVVDTFVEQKNDTMCVNNFEEFEKKVLRHEIIHAFLGESGLKSNSDWAENEEMVDWFAIQAPKLFKAFKELDLI